ncbi:hypothetical protein AwDysgo_04440 [Bacteroidales bacterium]|nr:hypothetical protein AwDysgo_04440 [Bacteroidales bacterium]
MLMKIKLILALFILLSPVAMLKGQGTTIKLSELELDRAYQQYSSPLKNRAANGAPFKVLGQTFDHGVGVYANSQIRIFLANNVQHFECKVGVNDNDIDYKSDNISAVPLTDGSMMFYQTDNIKKSKQFLGIGSGNGSVEKGSVVFKIIADGKEVFNSGTMRGNEAVKSVNLDLRGINVIDLICQDAGDGSSGDFGNWMNAQFAYSEIKPQLVEAHYVQANRVVDKQAQKHIHDKVSRLSAIQLPLPNVRYDWLLDASRAKAKVLQTHDQKSIVLTNGLVSRVFRITPNLATIDLSNQMTGQTLLRAVSSEGILKIDGKIYSLGGLAGQEEFGYTMFDWVDKMQALPNSFQVVDFEVGELSPRINWPNKRWSLVKKAPEEGCLLTFILKGPEVLENVRVKINYALYDGLPCISKWIEIENNTGMEINLDEFNLEQLAMVEPDSPVETKESHQFLKPNIHLESDWAFLGFTEKESERTEFWDVDPRYTSQCNYPLLTPCLLNIKLPMGPDVSIPSGKGFTTFRNWMMPFDSEQRERKGLFVQRMYKKIAPWVTENPIFMHCTSSDPKVVREAVDQCAATGYEMIILSFGSGLSMENESVDNIAKFREMRQYANSKGIELGGYSLLSSRWISDSIDVINPQTGKRGGMIFGSSPCLSSEWGFDYFRKIKSFFEKTGMTVFENDGSYPGNVCASTEHAHHKGLLDSQWEQRKQIVDLYTWMCEQGIYTNVPDFGYILNGSTKVGIGYREVNWSLPRERQLVLGRQVMYDGLWERLPSMCWTFVPLTEYHGGGAAATLEPLKDHLKDYKAHQIQNYGTGVQACYRGHRLYDSPETKQTVIEVIEWYKKYRDILNSEIVHLRRPDGKDYDGIMHVNPELAEKGFVMLYNPTKTSITKTIKLPLYYTGISKTASVREQEQKPQTYLLDNQSCIEVELEIPAQGYTWLVVE